MEKLTLVDSGFFIHFIRRFRDPVECLREHYESLDMATCGVVKAEVLRGLKGARARSRLEAFFNVLIFVPSDNRLWNEVTDLAWKLDREGVVLPLPDIIIAVSAMRIGAEVLTIDRHFTKIPNLRLAEIPDGWL